jgi:perosamine synthetase
MFRIPLMKPFVNQRVKDRVCAVLDSGFLTEGPVTRELEGAFRKRIGCKHALAATSATTGLEMALRAMKIGPGDEVIVPDFTYPATADVVAIVGATAVLVDIDPASFLIDYDAAAKAITKRTKAIMPVSEFGNPLDYDRLNEIKRQYGVAIIEDAACAIGSSFRGTETGNLADVTVFSMHPRKFITTGEGGMVTTNDDTLATAMDEYKHFGISGKDASGKPSFAKVGTNYKLSDIQAAVGVVQMEYADELLETRRQLAVRYMHLLAGSSEAKTPVPTPNGRCSWQSFCVKVKGRDPLMQRMRDSGIEVQFGAFALHRQPAFQQSDWCRWSGSLAGSSQAFDEALALPLHHGVSESDLHEVVAALRGQMARAA